jgi:hypothetical protein
VRYTIYLESLYIDDTSHQANLNKSYILLSDIPAGEATPEPPSDEQQVDAENFDDAQSVTTGAQSAVDSDESDTDTISDDDGALRNPLLFDEPSSNRL